MKKKVIAMLAAASIAAQPIACLSAAAEASLANDFRISINDKIIKANPEDEPPVIINGRVYVPLRLIGENAGASISWSDKKRQVIVETLSGQVSSAVDRVATPNSPPQIVVDGQILFMTSDLGKPMLTKKGRLLMPLRALGQALGCNIGWNNTQRLVSIKTKTATPSREGEHITLPETTVNNTPATPPAVIPAPPVVISPPAVQPVNPVIPSIVTPPATPAPAPAPDYSADRTMLDKLAAFASNLKLLDGSVINSASLAGATPTKYSADQMTKFRTYLKDLAPYPAAVTLPWISSIKLSNVSIFGDSVASAEQLTQWLNTQISRISYRVTSKGLSINTPPSNLAQLYIDIGKEYGIRGDIAFCQAAKETLYFQYTGDVKPYQNNFCGLWATGSACTGNESFNGADPTQVSFQVGVHGALFATPEAGVEAHIQHLYAYASAQPLPAGKTLLDPRFKLVKRQNAPEWTDLNARWAVPGTTYGHSIIYDYWMDALGLKATAKR